MKQLFVVVSIAVLTLFTIFGDYYLKLASHKSNTFLTREFGIGLAVYIVTAFIWTYIYRNSHFGIAGVVYSILSLLLFVFTGIIFFQETVDLTEILGISLGVVSLLMLVRYL